MPLFFAAWEKYPPMNKKAKLFILTKYAISEQRGTKGKPYWYFQRTQLTQPQTKQALKQTLDKADATTRKQLKKAIRAIEKREKENEPATKKRRMHL